MPRLFYISVYILLPVTLGNIPYCTELAVNIPTQVLQLHQYSSWGVGFQQNMDLLGYLLLAT